MDLRKITVRNSFYAVLSQIIMILQKFLSRFFLIRYVGVDQVGLSDTILSTVGALSLAEFGIGSAISYSLYTPLYNDDHETINKIMNVFQRLYFILSGIIFVAGVIGAFFLEYLLKGTVLNKRVYLIYFLYVCNTCISYLLCHRRTLLYADLKEYIVKQIDIMTNMAFLIIGLVAIFITHDIIFYITTVLLQTFISNIWIHVNSRKLYPYLRKGEIDKSIVKDTLMYAKNLFAGRIASFVYGSTDNLIVSGMLGTVYVGYLNNYSLISKSVQIIVSEILSPITPTIGRLQRDNNSPKMFYSIFLKYHQICYAFAFFVSVPMLVLFDGFIEFVFGNEYLLMPSIKYLLSFVLYVNIAAFAYGNVLTTSGKFKLLRQVETTGAAVNILASLLLVRLLGLPGILGGTVITVTVQWIMRSYMVYKNCLALSKRAWLVSIVKEIYKIMLVLIAYLCGRWFYNLWDLFYIFKFLICGCLCVAVSVFIYLCLYNADDKITIQDILLLLKRREND